jgi:hypothetical protein
VWVSFAPSENMYSVELVQATVRNNVAGASFNCTCQLYLSTVLVNCSCQLSSFACLIDHRWSSNPPCLTLVSLQ